MHGHEGMKYIGMHFCVSLCLGLLRIQHMPSHSFCRCASNVVLQCLNGRVYIKTMKSYSEDVQPHFVLLMFRVAGFTGFRVCFGVVYFLNLGVKSGCVLLASLWLAFSNLFTSLRYNSGVDVNVLPLLSVQSDNS